MNYCFSLTESDCTLFRTSTVSAVTRIWAGSTNRPSNLVRSTRRASTSSSWPTSSKTTAGIGPCWNRNCADQRDPSHIVPLHLLCAFTGFWHRVHTH
uniref:Uncharacterized protein n=1 Tax=Mesocestoides corti TaxID=53468 RepID=A0A5K3FLU4_MESCO